MACIVCIICPAAGRQEISYGISGFGNESKRMCSGYFLSREGLVEVARVSTLSVSSGYFGSNEPFMEVELQI